MKLWEPFSPFRLCFKSIIISLKIGIVQLKSVCSLKNMPPLCSVGLVFWFNLNMIAASASCIVLRIQCVCGEGGGGYRDFILVPVFPWIQQFFHWGKDSYFGGRQRCVLPGEFLDSGGRLNCLLYRILRQLQSPWTVNTS